MSVKPILAGVALLAMGLASCRRGPEPPAKPALSAQDLRAIAAAEEFLRKNGYTDRPHDPATLESVSRSTGEPVEFILRVRRNRTLGEAYGLSRHIGEGPGWTVYFEYNPAQIRELAARMRFFRQSETFWSPDLGTAVEVSPDFSDFVVPHMNICLRTAEVVLRPSVYASQTRPSAVEGWTVPGVDALREVVVRRLLGSSCADLPEPAWPLCIEVEEPAPRPKNLENRCGGGGVDGGYASNELVARVKGSTKRTVLSAAECIDLPPLARQLELTIHPLHRRRTGDAELLVYATLYSPEPSGSSEPFRYVELEATAIMQRTGWVLSSSKVEFLELPPREQKDRTTRTAGCS